MTEAVFKGDDSDSSVSGSGKAASKVRRFPLGLPPSPPCAKMIVYTREVTVNGRKRTNAF